MNNLIVGLSRAETFVLTWGVRLVGVLGVTLALVVLGWKAIESLLQWARVYNEFRKWYMDGCFAQAKAERDAREKKEYEARRAAEARGEKPPPDPLFDDEDD